MWAPQGVRGQAVGEDSPRGWLQDRLGRNYAGSVVDVSGADSWSVPVPQTVRVGWLSSCGGSVSEPAGSPDALVSGGAEVSQGGVPPAAVVEALDEAEDGVGELLVSAPRVQVEQLSLQGGRTFSAADLSTQAAMLPSSRAARPCRAGGRRPRLLY